MPRNIDRIRLACVFKLFVGIALTIAATALPGSSGAGRHPTRGMTSSLAFAAQQRLRAPSLEGGVGWLNTGRPIDLRDLRGKVVLLDFWTYCCINCMHMLPILRQLEEKYPNELVVVGVHSAKFETEKESENIRQAVLRYGIKHPVVNDADLAIWARYRVSVWPSLFVIDPEGYFVTGGQGELTFKQLDDAISSQIRLHRKKGTLVSTPLKFELEEAKVQATPLRFPGKILVDPKQPRLFIADSGHHRIVVVSLSGELLEIIGTGRKGRDDDGFDAASFNDPQGMAVDGQTLYVADNENHLIREVDLTAKTVKTIAGNGQKTLSLSSRGGSPTLIALSNPWDCVLVDHRLFIAMAGTHQIAVLDLQRRSVLPYSGSSKEDILDGTLRVAAHAQPSGVATDGKFLFVVDSEGSAVRSISLNPSGSVKTLVGASELPNAASLFQYGDIDGIGANARLQHPIGLAWDQGKLYVADTYNHKIKLIDPIEQTSRTLFGTGQAGNQDLPPQFHEPAGVSARDGTLYIADTNNHRICVADLAAGTMQTLTVSGLAAPQK